MTANCQACDRALDDPVARVTFESKTNRSLDGRTFRVHARCLRLEPTADARIARALRLLRASRFGDDDGFPTPAEVRAAIAASRPARADELADWSEAELREAYGK